MKVVNRIFPYPIYSISTDDYYDYDSFLVKHVYELVENSIQVNYQISISNKNLVNLINSNKIDMLFHIECPKTSYRKIEIIDQFEGTINIKNSKVFEKVEIVFFLIAKENIEIDKSFNISKEYGDTVFKVNKGNIMGYYNLDEMYVEKEKIDYNSPMSIFSVVKSLEVDEKVEIDTSSDKIQIKLNPEMFSLFNEIQANKSNLPIIHSLFIIPALVSVIEEIKQADIGEYYGDDKKWYYAICKNLENNGVVVGEQKFKNISSIKLAQIILNNPLKSALIKISQNGGE